MVGRLAEVLRLELRAVIVVVPLAKAMSIIHLTFIFKSIYIFFICINVVQVHLIVLLSEALLIPVSTPGLLKLANFLQVYLAHVL